MVAVLLAGENCPRFGRVQMQFWLDSRHHAVYTIDWKSARDTLAAIIGAVCAKVCEESNCSLREVCLMRLVSSGTSNHWTSTSSPPRYDGLRYSFLQPEFGPLPCCSQNSNQHILGEAPHIAIRNGGRITNLLFLTSRHSLTEEEPVGWRYAWQRPKPRRLSLLNSCPMT